MLRLRDEDGLCDGEALEEILGLSEADILGLSEADGL